MPLAPIGTRLRRIDETENALNAMKRPPEADEQKTAVQIRTYITRARKALEYDDLDGASTLTNKARALVVELSHGHSGQKAKLAPI